MSDFPRKHILVPTDFSPASLQAVQIARSVAESDADVTVVYVHHDYDLVVPVHPWGPELLPETNEEQQMQRLQMWINDNGLGDVGVAVRVGDPGTQVCELAEKTGCQLIIVPSHGYHGVQRVLLGSVAERIIRHCHCSVLVLRRKGGESIGDQALPWLPRRHVVVPFDFSDCMTTAVETAQDVAASDGRVSVLNVIPVLDEVQLLSSDVSSDDDRIAARRDQLTGNLARHGTTAVQVEVVVGDPGLQIAEFAEAQSADLIVMPSHGYHGLKRIALGSTTERVIRQSDCPVLVLRRQSDASDAEA